MSQHKNCPQCGTDLYVSHFNNVSCPVCGWGIVEASNATPPSGFLYYLSSKSLRWKALTLTSIFVSGIFITSIGGYGISQWSQRRSLARAQNLIDQRMYASAARVLNKSAASSTVSVAPKFSGRKLLNNSIRWAHDTVDVASAKDNMEASKPQTAIDSLDDVDEDFPQEDEAIELIDLAQEQTMDEDVEITDEILDDIAYVADDPELDNLDEITSDAIDDEVITPDEVKPDPKPAAQPTNTTTATNPSAPVTTSSPAPNVSEPEDEPIDEDSDDTLDDSEDLDELLDSDFEEPSLDELPESPEPVTSVAPAAPSQQTATIKKVGLVPFYQLIYINNPNAITDADTFLTTDLSGEVNPKKDKKSGFGNYGGPTVIGSLYNRRVNGNKNIVPLYRYWSSKKTDHFYTRNGKFAKKKGSKYTRQKVAGYIGKYKGGKCLEGTKPLYNLYSKKYGDNFYSTDTNAVKFVEAAGYGHKKIRGCLW